MATRTVTDSAAYRRLVDTFKTIQDGATAADLVARTALPLEKVKELLPALSDEYGARLRVSESGEILYDFPGGMKSRYRGFKPALKRFLSSAGTIAASVGKALFKVWIVAMLVGYFALFVILILVALLVAMAASMAGSSSDDRDDNRGGGMVGMYLVGNLLDMAIRIWFYSELTKSMSGYSRYDRSRTQPKKKPLHHAVFSFVFGDEDPNRDFDDRQKKAVISFLQESRGCISLAEFMILTGLAPAQAEQEISRYLREFNGSPEVTEEGTIIYRFGELLFKTEKKEAPISSLKKKLKKFSSNQSKMNRWFAAINGFNLLFGSYFLYCGLHFGLITAQAQVTGFNFLYVISQQFLFGAASNPVALNIATLGFIPLSFSALFYAIPAIRNSSLKKENEEIRKENLRRDSLKKIWSAPLSVKEEDITGHGEESTPENLKQAQTDIIKELGSYAMPDVTLADDGKPLYSFPELKREKEGVEAARKATSMENYRLGGTVFDSHADQVKD